MIGLKPIEMPRNGKTRMIKIILEKFEVLDDHDPWWKGAGEIRFSTTVTLNNDDQRAQVVRLPTVGSYHMFPGVQEVERVIYEGLTEESATLQISITGVEEDWFTPDDQFVRYRRRFSGQVSEWAGRYSPDDEIADPEAMADWRVWYRIEVEPVKRLPLKPDGTVWGGFRRREYFRMLRADPYGEVPRDLWRRGMKAKSKMRRPLPEDDDPGGPVPKEGFRVEIIGKEKVSVKEAEDPSPNVSFGSVNRFFRIESQDRLRETVIKIGIEPEEVDQVNPITLRVFRHDEQLKKLLLVPRSGLSNDGSYVWARIQKPGVYGVYGLPRDQARLFTARVFCLARNVAGFYRATGVRGKDLINPICRLILCPNGIGQSGLLENPEALEKIGMGDLVGDPFLLHGQHPGKMPTDDKGRPIGSPEGYWPINGPEGEPGRLPGERRPRRNICEECLGRDFPDDPGQWDLPECQIIDDPWCRWRPGCWTEPDVSCEKWKSMGPSNIAGRVKSLAFHPTDGNVLYAGVAEGGVWKSTDGGATWYPKMSEELSLSIGSVAVAPSNPDVVYAATGEYLTRWWWAGSSYDGEGVYRSTDGGNSWDLMPPIDSDRCSKVLIHPANPNLVYVAGQWGLHRWNHAANRWDRILTDDVSDIAMDPSNPQRLYAAVETADGIIKTENAEATMPVWTPFNNGLTLPARFVRLTKLAISPSNPAVIYATVNAEAQNSTGGWDLVGATVYRWNGATWVDKGIRIDSTQEIWCNVIAVHPTNPDHIIAAGVSLVWSPDGGNHWFGRGAGHADNHAAVFDPVNPNISFVANDGGIWKHIDVAGRTVSDFATVHSPDVGGMDIFSRGGDNKLWHQWWRSGSGWGGWEDLGGTIQGKPTVVYSPDAGGIDVFARWSDNSLRQRAWRPATGWAAWFDLGGGLTGNPAAIYSPDATGIDIFARGAGDSLRHRWWRPASGWAGWEDLGGTITSDPVVVYSPDATGIDIFARGTDGALWHRYWRPASGWGGWESLGGNLVGNPSAVYSPAVGGLDVFAQAYDGTLAQWAWRPATGWTWSSLGYKVSEDPCAYYSPEFPGVDVFARGRIGDMRHIYWRSGAGWSDESLGGRVTGGAAVSRPPELGGIDLFVRGLDNQMYHMWRRAGDAAWSWWEGLGFDTIWSYSSANGQLVTIQFYNVGVAQSGPFAIGGSTQDQGILKSNGSSVFIGMGGNEGGIFEVDPNNGNTIYWDPWSGDLVRTDSGTSAGARDATNGMERVNGSAYSIGALAINPSDSNQLVCSTDNKRIYYSSDGAAPLPATGWQQVVADTTDGVPRIAFAPSDPQRVYFITTGGKVWRSDNGGQIWNPVSDASLPGDDLIGLAVDWNNRDIVYVSYVGTGLAFGHVWMSENAGVTWRDISGVRSYSRLPDLPFHSIVQHYNRPETLYVATELGIFRTTDGGDWWYPFDEGLPNVVVADMDYRRSTNRLYVATIGRGMWSRRV